MVDITLNFIILFKFLKLVHWLILYEFLNTNKMMVLRCPASKGLDFVDILRDRSGFQSPLIKNWLFTLA